MDGVINKIDPGDAMEQDIYHMSERELKHIPQAPDNLEQALHKLRKDNEFLKKGGVFTDDLIETWTNYKMENEVKPMALRPHPYEFHLYYEV
jgi:glutamine synthetase